MINTVIIDRSMILIKLKMVLFQLVILGNKMSKKKVGVVIEKKLKKQPLR